MPSSTGLQYDENIMAIQAKVQLEISRILYTSTVIILSQRTYAKSVLCKTTK